MNIFHFHFELSYSFILLKEYDKAYLQWTKCLCSPYKFIYWNSNPQRGCIGGCSLRGVIRSWEQMNRISNLIKETPERSMVITKRESSGSKRSQDTKSAGALTLSFLVSRTVRNAFVIYKALNSCYFCYSNLSGLKEYGWFISMYDKTHYNIVK